MRLTLVAAVASTAIAVLLSAVIQSNPAYFTAAVRDVLAVARSGDQLPFFTGYVTFAGCVGWIAAAAAAVLAGWVALRRGSRRAGGLLLGVGGLSAILAADDLFMLHDGPLGGQIPEQAIMGTWVVLAGVWALTFRRELLADRTLPLLALAGVWFAHSFLADAVPAVGAMWLHEESTKFAAILCWFLWVWLRSVRTLLPATVDVRDAGAPAVDRRRQDVLS
ncbi:hypothetical protein CLV92_102146 [Kineococcus xinjiangensis]|uniref:DUF998 domain-containing protein n=1 Tax=Kineococcus xinjiangensis TaxID=512762 RepID=A0A2S6IUN6_9ACTN|nr:hypothetical protein [Kineococcus xinjiangensis]PPK97995.1 hypothetical protein CLV92_102146 [Kineococcus xinjiangensis]